MQKPLKHHDLAEPNTPKTMFSSSSSQLTGTLGQISNAALQQVRFFSRRRIAYPYYKAPKMGRTHPKDHKTSLRFMLQQFLGKKNYKGDYTYNKYAKTPQNHEPNYITPDLEKGNPLVDPNNGRQVNFYGNETNQPVGFRRGSKLAPFPNNKYCETNLNLTEEDKEEIYQRVELQKVPIQEVAIQMGIKIPRLEAVVTLKAIEKKWEKENKITSDLTKMSSAMYKLFPLFERPRHSENLSEIPVPVQTLQSRFVTIAESEPFGPVDAAQVFNLEPAADTLERLATTGTHSSSKAEKTKEREVFTAKSDSKDRYTFQFTKAKVGQVGFRYGTTQRDNKKDRKFTFDNSGKKINALPHSG